MNRWIQLMRLVVEIDDVAQVFLNGLDQRIERIVEAILIVFV